MFMVPICSHSTFPSCAQRVQVTGILQVRHTSLGSHLAMCCCEHCAQLRRDGRQCAAATPWLLQWQLLYLGSQSETSRLQVSGKVLVCRPPKQQTPAGHRASEHMPRLMSDDGVSRSCPASSCALVRKLHVQRISGDLLQVWHDSGLKMGEYGR